MTTQAAQTDGAPVTRRTRRSSGRRSEFQAPEYRLDTTMKIPARVAHFLDFAADKWPHRPIPYNVLLMFVMGYDRVPSMTDSDINHLKNSMQRAKKVLHETYNRGLIPERGLGVRASVDADDRTEHELIPAGKRLESAGTKFVAIRSSIDPSEFSNTEHGRALKGYHSKSGAVARQFREGSESIRALLPPITKPEGE